jgi:hypothetical protein
MINRNRSLRLIAWMVIVWTFVVTIARTIREPNDWAEAHWLLDYRFGFMKRGLIGTLCNALAGLFGGQMNPRIIFPLSAVAFCCMSAAILVILYRLSRQHQPGDSVLAVGVMFASSLFVVMNVCLPRSSWVF